MQRMEKLQYQTATGKKFRVPSDDPIGASKSLKFNTDLSKVEQYQRNAKDATSWMKETEGALKEINEVLKRSYELTNQAANGTNSADDLEKIKAEITELKGHVIQIANTTYAGRSIFTGYKTDQKLLDEDGNYNVNLEKQDVLDKDGNPVLDDNGDPVKKDETFVYNVGVAETVSVNTLGNKVFGSGTVGNPDYTSDVTVGDKPYLIHIFDELEKALGTVEAGEEPDQDLLQSSITNFQDAMGNIMSVTAEIGAKTNRLNMTTNKLADQALNLEELLSFNEDISLPEAYMKLSIEENVYRASLAVGAKVIQPSLMDFLR
jgi:flagellar hook-associated protein 3 FlgL